jgi:multidrug efflux system membrane fusion protein
MFWARVTALTVVLLTGLWIGSGYLRPSTIAPPVRNDTAKPAFRVVVMDVAASQHSRRYVITGRTQSDQRVLVSARTNGIVTRVAVRRGSIVKRGDVIAELSDEAREAIVMQARARLAQRAAELEAREALARRGNYPMLNLEQLRAEKQGAEAALATAEVELLRAAILAPIEGLVNDLTVEVGQGMQSGAAVAEIIAPDPMLAVVELPERRLAGIRVGDQAEIRLVTGETRQGKVRFVARRPGGVTRTFRVDVEFANPDGAIADGIAAEVALVLAPVPAARVPRSALTFSAEGQLGLRIVDAASMVQFVPVTMVDDEESHLWVSGLASTARVIIRGQEFIREGQKVEAVLEAKP